MSYEGWKILKRLNIFFGKYDLYIWLSISEAFCKLTDLAIHELKMFPLFSLRASVSHSGLFHNCSCLLVKWNTDITRQLQRHNTQNKISIFSFNLLKPETLLKRLNIASSGVIRQHFDIG